MYSSPEEAFLVESLKNKFGNRIKDIESFRSLIDKYEIQLRELLMNWDFKGIVLPKDLKDPVFKLIACYCEDVDSFIDFVKAALEDWADDFRKFGFSIIPVVNVNVDDFNDLLEYSLQTVKNSIYREVLRIHRLFLQDVKDTLKKSKLEKPSKVVLED